MQDKSRDSVYRTIFDTSGKTAIVLGVPGVVFGYLAGYREIELAGGVLSALGLILLICRGSQDSGVVRRFDR